MKLTKKSETSSKITFTYDKPAGPVEGYLYYAGGTRVSRTFNPNDLEVTFGKVPSGEYAVEAIGFDVIDKAVWPDVPIPPEPPPGNPAPWLGSFDASYQAAPIGSVITVPAGTYGTQVINYRAGLAKLTGSLYVRFVMGGAVQVNGQLEVHGPRVHIDGGNKLRVSGYTDTEGDSLTKYPDHVLFENLQSGNIGVFSSTDVTFRNIDCGPSTVGANCNRIENKIGYGSGVEVNPSNILFDRVYIHNQNVNAAGRASDCHYGGLFIVSVDGLVIRNSRFERNVVYHIQIQNFSGPPAKNVLFENNSFGAPVEWLEEGGENTPNGQRAIQFDYDPAGQFTLTNNVASNGPFGLYGCYVGNCGGVDANGQPLSVKEKESGTSNLPVSVVAPPLP
jgi:hypothetical protein